MRHGTTRHPAATSPSTSTTECSNIELDSRRSTCAPYDSITNVQLKKGNTCCTLGNQYTFNPSTNEIDWTDGNETNVRITWDTVTNGACGTPPSPTMRVTA